MTETLLIVDCLPEIADLCRLVMMAGVTNKHEEQYLMDKVIIAIRHQYLHNKGISDLVDSICSLDKYCNVNKDSVKCLLEDVCFKLLEKFSNDGMYEGGRLMYSISTFLGDGGIVLYRNN